MKYFSLPLRLFALPILLLLPGCLSITDWGKKTFYQGDVVVIDFTTAQEYIRTVTAYDQFTLIANFDVLWLSAVVREFYIQTLVKSLGKSDQEKDMLLARSKDELKHFISFYVITPYDIILGEQQSNWSLLLEIGTSVYHPIEIKVVDLHPIYTALFSKRVMRFCTVYQVKFDAQSIDGTLLISDATDSIGMIFRSLEKELKTTWSIKRDDKQ